MSSSLSEDAASIGESAPPVAAGESAAGLGSDPRHFRAVVEALPVAVYTTDAAGRITFYNEAAAALWGCRPAIGGSEFCGSWKLYWPDGTPLPHAECPMAIALRDKRRLSMEAVAERPDGSRVPFQAFPAPIFDEAGAFIGAANMLVDLTERKRAEETAQHLAAIVESSDDAIASKNLDGIVTSWNGGAERLFGFTAGEMIGQPITLVIPPERLHEETTILSRIRRGERVDHFETVRRRKDGGLVEISLTVSPVRDPSGRIVGASKVARDISDRRRAEVVKELVLNEMRHRIKNNLTAVQALATRTLTSATSQERAAFTARIRALASAHDLLTNHNWTDVRVGEVARRALAPFQERHRDRVVVEGPDAVSLDANKSLLLTMALHELATNAAKYGALSNGSGQVRVAWQQTPAGELELRWQESGGPLVKPPQSKGFGSQLIEQALEGEQGRANFAFDPAGLACRLTLPL